MRFPLRSIRSSFLTVCLAAAVISASTGAMSQATSACEELDAELIAIRDAFKRDGDDERALTAAQALLASDRSVDCRNDVLLLMAEVHVQRRSLDDAVTAIRTILDSSGSTVYEGGLTRLTRLFEETRVQWRETHAGPLQVVVPSPDEPAADPNPVLRFRGTIGETVTARLIIRSSDDGELTWRVDAAPAWLEVSRTSGTTVDHVDTLMVAAVLDAASALQSVAPESLRIVSGGWPAMSVPLSREVSPIVDSQETGGGLPWGWIGAAVVGGAVALLIHDPPPPDEIDPLSSPPDPPFDR